MLVLANELGAEVTFNCSREDLPRALFSRRVNTAVQDSSWFIIEGS